MKVERKKNKSKVGKVRFEPKTKGVEGIAHSHYDPHSLNHKLTLLFELRQDRRIPNHFQT